LQEEGREENLGTAGSLPPKRRVRTKLGKTMREAWKIGRKTTQGKRGERRTRIRKKEKVSRMVNEIAVKIMDYQRSKAGK
jgi:hypothetical protein